MAFLKHGRGFGLGSGGGSKKKSPTSTVRKKRKSGTLPAAKLRTIQGRKAGSKFSGTTATSRTKAAINLLAKRRKR